MQIAERIPDLSDKELETLHANALRLSQSGSSMQRQAAEELLPLLGVALEERKAARLAAQAETRRATTSRRKSAAGASPSAKAKKG
ncbi:MAG: hypothetical protein ABUS57_03145 [Pseudomonadota bacterium]